MSRRRSLGVVCLTLLTLAVTPAWAAPKTQQGTYRVSLLPDPTLLVAQGCDVTVPAAVDEHPLALSGAGVLEVELRGPEDGGVSDWDLYVLAADEIVAQSQGPTAREIVKLKIKSRNKRSLSIQVCNVHGATEGAVRYLFTPAG